MKFFRKIVCVCAAAIVACTSVSTPAFASEVIVENETSTVMPCADVIVYKYRISNGVYQYRRWNQTQGYWVDPEWIDM